MSAGHPGDRYATVAVAVPVRRLFTYRVGQALDARIATGVRVRVPFGRRKLIGTVVEWPAPQPAPELEVKAIEAVLDDGPTLTEPILELTRFLADYYLCSWGEAIEAALPPARGRARRLRAVRRMPGRGLEELLPKAVARRRLFESLPPDGRPVLIGRLGRSARRVLPALVALGLVETLEVAPASPPAARSTRAEPAPPELRPTPGQAAALERLVPALARGVFAPFLLYGATGSGKTEVYLRAAREALDRGRGVLYLVPEIGLTALLVSALASRFPEGVAVLHSGMPNRVRFESWAQVRDGRCRVVLGTRSAVFAPLGELGLIVVDEEQDGSYKQEESPRYNARDLAVVRARAEQAVVLLGSATPSLESFHHARSGRYELLALGGRVARGALPEVRLVDMRQEYQRTGRVAPLSRLLARELVGCVERGEQALVLRNRRGWAAALFCPRCGGRVACTQCSISMTWHRAQARLCCHYCGFNMPAPERCPVCKHAELKFQGEGTERIEELIREAVPGAVVERMDRDTVRGRGAHERLLRRFAAREIDVLVGTQMIAKGHDFPQVTLVGVVSADQALGLPDFRGAERTFQLLIQVAGRAGRGDLPGIVVVQAFDTGHPVLAQAVDQDYEGFFEREMGYRRALRYPPLAALVQLVIQDRQQHRARYWAELLAEALLREGQGKLLLGGPGPAPIERLKGRFRQQILVRTAGRRRLVGAVERALSSVAKQVPRRAILVDVDPYSLL